MNYLITILQSFNRYLNYPNTELFYNYLIVLFNEYLNYPNTKLFNNYFTTIL